MFDLAMSTAFLDAALAALLDAAVTVLPPTPSPTPLLEGVIYWFRKQNTSVDEKIMSQWAMIRRTPASVMLSS